jgi:hypothetical protein
MELATSLANGAQGFTSKCIEAIFTEDMGCSASLLTTVPNLTLYCTALCMVWEN